MSVGEGPVTSFESLYPRLGGLVYTVAMAILGDRQLAEDASQETWVRIDRALERGFAPQVPEAWVATIARREALRLRGRSTPPSLPFDPAAPPAQDPVETEENAAAVRRAMSRLPAEDRRLLVLAYLGSVKKVRICRALNIPRASFYKKLAEARTRLRMLLDCPPDNEGWHGLPR